MEITEQQKLDIESHMIHESEALKTIFKAKNTEFVTLKVSHNLVEDYERKGYMVVAQTKLKTTMRIKKNTGIQFEDDVWSMFYKLGFKILNKDESLRVQWGPNKEDTQQLDVVAVGEDAIFVVECKASSSPKPGNFKKDLNCMEQYMPGVTEVLQGIYGKDKRVKFIFATRNYRFQEEGEDISRMNGNGIFHLNDNSYNYIDNLIKSYKEAVIYQFYALMFKDELINNSKINIPALRGKMGGKTYYLFSIEPSKLLKVGFVLHRTKVNDSMAPTYQRLLVPSRLKGITKFINEGGYFPNSIIINFSAEKPELNIRFTPTQAKTDSNAEFGFLYIPNAYGIAHIVDGQHRIYGYANSDYKDVNTIPVVAFEGMPTEEQLKIFMDINENQKSVSKNLLLDLEEDMYWKSTHLNSRMKALRSSIIKDLTGNSNHILYNMISVGEDSAELSFDPFSRALSKSSLLPKASVSQYTEYLDVCLYNTNETDIDKAMKDARKRISQFIDGAYYLINNLLPEDKWTEFILCNRGTYAFVTLIGSLHSYLLATDVFTKDSSINERLAALTPYLKALAEGLNNISDEESANMKGALGAGADPFWLHSFQNMINKKYSEYNPEELIKWKETQDQDIQKEGNDLKEQIQELLKNAFFTCFQKVHGLKWEKDPVICRLKHVCEGKIYDEYEDGKDNEDYLPEEQDWKDWIEIIDLKKIIEKEYSNEIFEKVFSINVGLAFKTKKEKLAWISMVEPSKGKKQAPMTRSDVNRLWMIQRHLSNFVSEDEVQ